MSTLTTLIEAWDEGHRELGIALDGVPDDDLWLRPHPRLLSIGEVAGHIAFAQTVWIVGQDYRCDLSQLSVQSPLVDSAFRYYSVCIEQPAVVLDMNASAVWEEVQRVHREVKATLEGRNADDPVANWETWGNLMQYQVFHVAYHTGQIYSARHIFGHQTEDN